MSNNIIFHCPKCGTLETSDEEYLRAWLLSQLSTPGDNTHKRLVDFYSERLMSANAINPEFFKKRRK
jgi:hypothetical protein